LSEAKDFDSAGRIRTSNTAGEAVAPRPCGTRKEAATRARPGEDQNVAGAVGSISCQPWALSLKRAGRPTRRGPKFSCYVLPTRETIVRRRLSFPR